jgi:hypothetical protein
VEKRYAATHCVGWGFVVCHSVGRRSGLRFVVRRVGGLVGRSLCWGGFLVVSVGLLSSVAHVLLGFPGVVVLRVRLVFVCRSGLRCCDGALCRRRDGALCRRRAPARVRLVFVCRSGLRCRDGALCRCCDGALCRRRDGSSSRRPRSSRLRLSASQGFVVVTGLCVVVVTGLCVVVARPPAFVSSSSVGRGFVVVTAVGALVDSSGLSLLGRRAPVRSN